MRHSRLVSALTKLGIKVNAHEYRKNSFNATGPNGRRIQWYTQDGFDEKTLKSLTDCPEMGHVTEASPDTNAQTDCFCDTYYKTIKEAVEALTDKK